MAQSETITPYSPEPTGSELTGPALTGRIRNWLSKVSGLVSVRGGDATLLTEAGQILGENFESPDHGEKFAGQVAKIIDFDFLSLAQIDHSEWTVEKLYQHGTHVSGMTGNWSINLAAMPQPEVFSTRTAAMCELEQAAHDGKKPAWWMYRAGLRSMITAPIIADATVIGILVVASRLPRHYEDADTHTVQLLADAISGSFSNLRLHGRLRREFTERETISAIARTISSSLDIESSMPDFAHDLWNIVPANGVTISLTTGVDDRIEERWSFGITSTSKNSQQRSVLSAEMKVGETSVGRLSVFGAPHQKYTRHHLALLNTVASSVSGAIAAAEMHGRSMELAETRIRQERTEAEKRELQMVALARSEFLITVSHELRTPLTSILAFADLLKRNTPGNLIDKQEHQLGIIQRNGRQLAVLIEDLLNVTQIEQSKFELEPTRFDIVELVADLTESLVPVLSAKDQELIVELPDEPITMFADRARLSQVISNITTNASKYSNPNTIITVAVSTENDVVNISVKDEGIGITEDDIPRIFGAFYRADNEGTRTQSGVGVGLHFCRLIVDHHDGQIRTDSEVGKGTTMTVSLPLEFKTGPVASLSPAA